MGVGPSRCDQSNAAVDSIEWGMHLRRTIANPGPAYPPCRAGMPWHGSLHARGGDACIPPRLTAGSPTDMPIRLLLLALLATCLASTAGRAQHGTPFELRGMTPEVEDAAPGQEPGPESKNVPEIYRRQPVFYRTGEAPGTIIIDTSERFLYLIQGNNTALRYGIGVGRDGFQWNGLLKVTRKAEWPDWT